MIYVPEALLNFFLKKVSLQKMTTGIQWCKYYQVIIMTLAGKGIEVDLVFRIFG